MGMVILMEMTSPPFFAGLNFHFASASKAGCENASLVDFSTLGSVTLPFSSMVQLMVTTPETPSCLRSGGYLGETVRTGTGGSIASSAQATKVPMHKVIMKI